MQTKATGGKRGKRRKMHYDTRSREPRKSKNKVTKHRKMCVANQQTSTTVKNCGKTVVKNRKSNFSKALENLKVICEVKLKIV